MSETETMETLLPRVEWQAPKHPTKPPECPNAILRGNVYLERLEEFIQGGYSEWDAHDLATLGAFLELMESKLDASTPFEYFIHSCMCHYRYGHTMTPERIEEEFEEFRAGLNGVLEDARYCLRNYPDLLKDEPAPAEK
jgi:hypothetical protein